MMQFFCLGFFCKHRRQTQFQCPSSGTLTKRKFGLAGLLWAGFCSSWWHARTIKAVLLKLFWSFVFFAQQWNIFFLFPSLSWQHLQGFTSHHTGAHLCSNGSHIPRYVSGVFSSCQLWTRFERQCPNILPSKNKIIQSKKAYSYTEAGAGLAVTPDVVRSYYAEAEQLNKRIKDEVAKLFKGKQVRSSGK